MIWVKVATYYMYFLPSNPPTPPVQLAVSPSANTLVERGPLVQTSHAYLRFYFSLLVTALYPTIRDSALVWFDKAFRLNQETP